MQAHSLAVTQQEFGDSNPQMVPVLTADAGELRKPGKAQDTAKLEKRAAELQSATMAPPPQRTQKAPILTAENCCTWKRCAPNR
jgi:hypothetical protein